MMMEVSEPAKGFIKITDNHYDTDKVGAVERFLNTFDYSIIVDFQINFKIEGAFIDNTIYFYPKDGNSNFIEVLKNLDDIKENIDSLKNKDGFFSFELLLLKVEE